MTGTPNLSGKAILIVEDDYYAAVDTAVALRQAGADILGPCPTEAAAVELLAELTPTAAVVDVNLGGREAKFELAHQLLERGVPFVFVTGYDPGSIPVDFAKVKLLQKPIPLREIAETIAAL